MVGWPACALCGQGVFGLTRKRSWNRKNGEKVDRTYRYYECPRGTGPGNGTGEGHASWRAAELEGIVRDKLLELAKSGRLPRGGSDAAGSVRLSPARGKCGRFGKRIHEGVEVCSLGLRQRRQPDNSTRKSPRGAGGWRKRKRRSGETL